MFFCTEDEESIMEIFFDELCKILWLSATSFSKGGQQRRRWLDDDFGEWRSVLSFLTLCESHFYRDVIQSRFILFYLSDLFVRKSEFFFQSFHGEFVFR